MTDANPAARARLEETATGLLAGAVPLAPARGVELVGPMEGSGYAEPPLLVRRVDGQSFHLTPLLFEVLRALDGRRNDLEVAWEVARATGRVLTAEEVRYLADKKLRPLGLLAAADGSDPALTRMNPLLGLRLRLMVSNPRVTNLLTAPFARLFHPAIVAAVVTAFVALLGWLFVARGLSPALHDALYEPGLLLLLIVLTVVSAGFHEFGHAAACRYGGATPGAMGAAIYLVWPVFYTDVTDSYRLGRTGRLRVDLGGLYFNAIFALVTFGAWAVTGAEGLLLMVPIQVLQMGRQLLPLVRFDGYHILADVTGVPDLFARVRPTLSGLRLGRRGRGDYAGAAGRPLKGWVNTVVTGWVIVVIPALAAGLVLLGMALPRVVATAWDSLGLHWGTLLDAVDRGDVTGMGLGAVSLFALAVPPLSMGYLVGRLASRSALRTWRASEGQPALRGLAGVAAVSFVVAGALVLWPEGQYVPVDAAEAMPGGDDILWPERSERAEPPERRLASRERPQRAAADDDRARRQRARVARAATVPARPAWPFPFPPPDPAGAGDNHAVAVNTVDQRPLTEVAFSLDWVDGTVANGNRAYAFASCRGCSTTAAAFQVLIISGDAPTVVPENAAVAANYQCTNCMTSAIALQLVVDLDEPLPAGVLAELDREWAAVNSLRGGAQTMTAEKIHVRLVRHRDAISALLAPYGQVWAENGAANTDEETDEVVDGDTSSFDTGDSASAGSSTTTSSTSTSTTSSSTSTSTSTTSTSTTSTSTTSTTAPSG